MNIVLASKSPRRVELLRTLIKGFEVCPSVADEVITSSNPESVVCELALNKASDVFHSHNMGEDVLIIGADTIVVSDDKIIGKPKSRTHAFEMLRGLSGRTHEVFTGVCLLKSEAVNTIRRLFCVRSEVLFRTLSDDEIERYIDTGSPFDKAGGYGIQDSGFVADIRGSYTNVMGLPLERLKEELVNCGIDFKSTHD
ncbi:MAG: Maf family protein [Clostridia bacterium]|nr:Maf family protein [Clostridia bacterium]